MIYNGNTQIAAVYLCETRIKSIYKGSEVIFASGASVTVTAPHATYTGDMDVDLGDSYTATLVADTGYVIMSVVVTMGGVEISAYSEGVISIAEVTGDIVITATTVKEYDVLEYIAIDREGYYGVIDTGVTGSKNIKIEADYMLTAHRTTISSADGLFGAETSFSNNSFTFMAEANVQGRAYFCLGNANKQVNGLSLNTKYHVEAGTTFKLNGNTQTLNPSTFSTPQAIRIFSIGRVNMAETTATFLGRLYSLKIYDGNTLVRDYEPRRRNTDNMVSLYDKVNNVFYLPDNNIPYVAGQIAED